MPAKLVSRLLFRRIFPSAVVLCSAGLWAAAQSPPAAQAPATQSIPSRDLTRPQAQPSLTLDRDPVLSPDMEERPSAPNTPQGATAGNPAQPGGKTLEKQGSGFVFRAEVEEVQLPSTVVDEKGHLV